ncbi:MAG: SGNH/GDSL hydrolase family protein [Bacteroidota bacterium]
MIKRKAIFIIGWLICLNLFAQPYQIPQTVKKILFLGNSITYQGDYISFIESYLTLKYRDTSVEFINVGLSSETVSGLSEPNHAGGAFPRPDLRERLERVLNQVKPDLIFTCYGMNDGIYLPFGLDRFEKYREGIQWLNKEATDRNIEIIFVTPPIYDKIKGPAYANVLDIYSDWLMSCRYTESWKVIDLHWPMDNFLQEKRILDSSFYLAKDGIHPNSQGHWLMAREILIGIGEQQLRNIDDPKLVFANYEISDRVLELVKQKQSIMKHAWLSQTKHKRPGVPPGLPMKEAIVKKDSINGLIKNLVN